MIAFGASITMPDVYARCAGPGIALAAEPGSPVFAHAAAGSIARSYNLVLDGAARLDGLEALVLVHQDLELRDRRLGEKLRRVLADPEVGVVGCVGSTGAAGIAWWDGAVTWGSTVYRHGELGGGERAWGACEPPPPPEGRAVDALYGVLLALSPWAVRELRFDEALGPRHGYDFDLCRQVRAAGRKVVVADLDVVHHHSLDLVADPDLWAEAHERAAAKWDRPMPVDPGDDAWRARARHAEADAGAARLLLASRQLQSDAAARRDAEELATVTATASWRVTAPLRGLNARRRARRDAG